MSLARPALHLVRRRHAPALALFLLACGEASAPERATFDRATASNDVAVSAVGAPPPPPPPMAPAPSPMAAKTMPRGQGEAAEASVAVGAAGGASAAQPGVALPGAAATAMLIRTGQASVEVREVDAAVAQLRQLATRLGGYVASSTLQGGADQVRAATLELKIPSPRFDEAVSGLAPLGDVEQVSVNAVDVGEEFTDLTARVANARRLEERLLVLLAQRTGRLEDVLAVERELARVREEIERMEGRLRWLESRVALSTLTVTAHEPYPLVAGRPGGSPIGDAFRDAWRNFVALVAGIIASLGIVIPLGLVALAVWFAWRRLRPRGPAGVARGEVAPER